MRRWLYALIILGMGMVARAQDLQLVISGNTHSRIYLVDNGKKICLPCNRANLINRLGDNVLLLEYGYLSPGSYGDLLHDKNFFDKRKKDYQSCLRKIDYDWVCDIEGQCQDKVLEGGSGVKIGIIKVGKERINSPDKYNVALANLEGADVLVLAIQDNVRPEDLWEFLRQHSEVDIVLVPRRSFLRGGKRLEIKDGVLVLMPYPDGIKVDVVDLTNKGGKWSVLGAKEVSVLGFSPDSRLSHMVDLDCYGDMDCLQGECNKGKCTIGQKKGDQTLVVVRPKRCVSCNEDDIYNWLKRFLPSLKMKVIYSDSEEAKKIFAKVNTDMLPVYIIQGNIENIDGFENIEDMLIKSEIGYVIRPQVVGMSVFRNRKRIPKRVDIFISGQLSEPVYKELVQIRKVKYDGRMKDWRFYFHYLLSYKNGVWKSLIGPNDMSEVLRQLCFRKYAPNKYLDYILCRYELGYPQDDTCEVRLGVDSGKIEQCITTPGEIGYLLLSSSKLTNEIGANTPGLILFENQQIFVPSADVIKSESFKKWSEGKE